MKMSLENTSFIFKLLTLGESGVGKTSILRRLVENEFSKAHLATIGIDYHTKVPFEKKLKIFLIKIINILRN